MSTLFERMKNGARRVGVRAFSAGLPEVEEIERFGADGEDVIYRMLRDEFETVIRGVVIPHKGKYLEKDFLVMHKGVPVVIEVKNWKGTVGRDKSTGDFYQDKPNGTHKVLKSPVGTTQQYIRCMKQFYGMERTVVGMVIFAEPDCVLDLPESVEDILLVPAVKAVQAIRAQIRLYAKEPERLSPDRILHCTRIYSTGREFCKGLLADRELHCYTANGSEVMLNTDYLRYIRVEHQNLLLRDKLLVTYTNGAKDVFYNRDAVLSLCCLDGSCRRVALNKTDHILF